MERVGLDFECLSSSAFRCHVLHARNAHLAPVEEPRRGSQEVIAIPSRSVSLPPFVYFPHSRSLLKSLNSQAHGRYWRIRALEG